MSTRPSTADPDWQAIRTDLGLETESGTKTSFRRCVVELREEFLRRSQIDRYEATVAELASAVGFPESVVRAALEAMQHDAPRRLSVVESSPQRWRVEPPGEEEE